MEKITVEEGWPDAWVCLCGNSPASHGFDTCDVYGNSVEPIKKLWTTNCYVCCYCGRIIDQDSLEVVGRRAA